ncbi:MAG: hypothetical protein GY940_14455 [bacterium]|nr:hypothetical protein [bacterium]
MKYEFKLRTGKGFVNISGPLAEADSAELKRLIESALLLEKCHTLELNIDSQTSVSPSCKRALKKITGMARNNKTSLTIQNN